MISVPVSQNQPGLTNMNTGNIYKTREGKNVTVINFVKGHTHPVVCLDDKKKLVRYTTNGRFLDDDFDHKQDIIFENERK